MSTIAKNRSDCKLNLDLTAAQRNVLSFHGNQFNFPIHPPLNYYINFIKEKFTSTTLHCHNLSDLFVYD